MSSVGDRLRLPALSALTALVVAGAVFATANLFSLIYYLPYAGVGAFLIARRPGNAVGWLVLALGYTLMAATTTPSDLDLGALAAGTASFRDFLIAWVLASAGGAFSVLVLALALVFPTGHLPGKPWRWVALAVIALGALLFLVVAFAPTITFSPDDGVESVDFPNRFAILPELSLWAVAPRDETIAIPALGLPAIGAVTLVVRYRRSTGTVRLQLRWLVAAVAFVVVAVAAGLSALTVFGEGIGLIAWIPAIVAHPTVPAAIGVAVLRYRLLEIDGIINRTLVYGSVTLALAGAVGVANVAAQRAIETVTGASSDLVTGALVVGAALAFGPLRRRVRPLVDRVLPARAKLTLLFNDIVGSTTIAAEVGDERWQGLLERYRAAVRRELTRFNGREIDTAGDGFFVTFDRPIDGLTCAWAIRAAVQALGLETRSGLHIGECAMRGEKVSGLAVHVAARVMAAAEPGEVLISSDLRNTVGDGAVGVLDRGRHTLKGVPGEWRLYRVEAMANERRERLGGRLH
jgi:class 3 adenylate cyclase